MGAEAAAVPGAWRLGLAAVLVALLGQALAATLLYLARDESLCDAGGNVCLRGTLTYDGNSRVLWLRGRVERADGPGVLRLMLSGTSRPGTVRYATMEVGLRGRLTEIVDYRMVPDEPDVGNWRLDRIGFTPKGAD